MSQRTALLMSLMLTLIVAGTIAFNRDRLMGTNAEETATSGQAQTGEVANDLQNDIRQSLTRGGATLQTSPRVIEVTLPADAATSLQGQGLSADDWDDHDDNDHDSDDYDDDHHDDDHDDDHGDDDDD